MKNKVMHIVRLSFKVLAAVGVVLLLAFVGTQQAEVKCASPIVTVDRSETKSFISDEEVVKIAREFCTDSASGFDLEQIVAMEKRMMLHPAVAEAEVFVTANGNLHVNIFQREPIARIVNKQGEDFYMDIQGKLMPIVAGYPARVVVVNGEITERFSDVPYFLENDSLAQYSILDELYSLLSFIYNDPFWKAQIEQVYVLPSNKFVLIPKVGRHEIEFGTATFIAEKFKKLEIFYQDGLSKEGWDEYRSIDIQYKNQIVCKRNISPMVEVVADTVKNS